MVKIDDRDALRLHHVILLERVSVVPLLRKFTWCDQKRLSLNSNDDNDNNNEKI